MSSKKKNKVQDPMKYVMAKRREEGLKNGTWMPKSRVFKCKKRHSSKMECRNFKY